MNTSGCSGECSCEIHGVEVNFLAGGIPMISLDIASVFHEHVLSMLQAAVGSGQKAESLYEYCEDEHIAAHYHRQGIRDCDIMLAQMKKKSLKDMKAVGLSGKRSVVFGLVLRLALEKDDDLHDLRGFLDTYSLKGKFSELLKCCRRVLTKAP